MTWIIRNLVPAIDEETIIASPTDLYRALGRRLGSRLPSERSWARYLAEGRPSDQILTALRLIYPQLNSSTIDLLSCGYDTFEHRTGAVQSAYARWSKATQLFGEQRRLVELLGKQVYSGLDELDDLPLIGRRSWISTEPLKLGPGGKDMVTYGLSFDNSQRTTLPLQDLTLPYHVLKLKSRGKDNRHTFNGNCFIVKGISSVEGRFRVEFGQGGYFDYVNTCEAHAALLADMIAAGTPADEAAFDRCSGESGWDPGALLDWNSRTAFLGVNSLLILKGFSGADHFFLHRRSGRTIEAQNVWHVAPAGGHQPLDSLFSDPAEQSLGRTVSRELLEEFFDCNELFGQTRHGHERLTGNVRIRRLSAALFENGATEIFFLGIGLDPATTKPEALCVTIVDWQRAHETYHRLTAKDLYQEVRENWEGKFLKVPLSRSALLARSEAPRWGETMLPAGAACLLLTARHYELLGLA